MQAETLIQTAVNNFLFDPQYKEIRDKIRADPDNAQTILSTNQSALGVDLNLLCNENPELLQQIVEEIQEGSQVGDEEISESDLHNMLAGADRRFLSQSSTHRSHWPDPKGSQFEASTHRRRQ